MDEKNIYLTDIKARKGFSHKIIFFSIIGKTGMLSNFKMPEL